MIVLFILFLMIAAFVAFFVIRLVADAFLGAIMLTFFAVAAILGLILLFI